MKWGRAKVSAMAIALSALAGCCPDPTDNPDDGTVYCNLFAESGAYPNYLTVKGTALYTTDVTGDAVVTGFSYSDSQQQLIVDDPKQPFSLTAQLDVGDWFSSGTYGHLVNGSIVVRNTFTPADGSAVIVHEQSCRPATAP